MTFTYNTKKRSRVTIQNTSNQKILKNLKIKCVNPLYFYEKMNKNLSNKENFYQYIFIEYIFANKFPEWVIYQNNKLDSNFWNTTQKTLPIKTSLILENLMLVPSQNNSKLRKNHRLKYKKKKSKQFFLHDKIFITYQKSFLCYWLLPFIGLLGVTGPTLVKSSEIAKFPTHGVSFQLKNNTNSKIINQTINSPYAIIPNENNSKSALADFDYSLLLSKSTQSKNQIDNLDVLSKVCLKSKSQLNKNSSLPQSLLLTAFNFSLKNNELIKSTAFLRTNSNLFIAGSPLNLTDFNFMVLQKIIKKRSNLKWYWFDLLINQTAPTNVDSLFPNKICSTYNLKVKNTKRLQFRPEWLIREKITSSSPNFDYIRQTDLNKEKNSFLAIATKNLTETLLNLQKTKNNLNFDNSINLPTKTEINPIKGSKLTSFNTLIVSENKKVQSNVLGRLLKTNEISNKNTFLIGLIKPKQIQEKLSNSSLPTKIDFINENKLSTKSKSPYTSLKKAYFLMDQIRLTNPEIFNSPFFCPKKTWLGDFKKPINFVSLSGVSQKKTHEETILLLFKNKLNILKQKSLNSKLLLNNDNKKSSLLGKKKTHKIIHATESDILYNSIFEGLKNSLDLIHDSKEKQDLIPEKPKLLKSLKITTNPLYKTSIPLSNYCSLNLQSLLKNQKSIFKNSTSEEKIKIKKSFVEYNSKNSTYVLDPFECLIQNYAQLYNHQPLNTHSLKPQFSVLTLNNSLKGGNLETFIKKEKKQTSFKNKPTFGNKEALFRINQNQFFTKLNDLNSSLPKVVNTQKTNIKKGLDKIKKSKNFNFKKSQLNHLNFDEGKNSFLILSNYLDLITNNIKTGLSPYKFRLTYLPELNKSYQTNDFVNPLKKQTQIEFLQKRTLEKNEKNLGIKTNQKFKIVPNGEKLFLSYLSRAKKVDLKTSIKNKSDFIPSKKKYNKQMLASRSLPNLKAHTKTKLLILKPIRVPITMKTLFLGKNPPNETISKSNFNNKTMRFKKFTKKISPLMLLKNRLFTNNAAISSQSDLSFSGKEGSDSLTSLRRRNTLKIKRRLKKMKCETRRRKKRKIFYPRPTWIVSSMYRNFLDARYFNNSTQKQIATLSNLKSNNQTKFNRINGKYDSNKKTYSHWLNANRLRKQNISASSVLKKDVFLQNTKDFYRISGTVFTDLKRVLMKSNWLRSYLNPYLDKVKTIYKQMQNSSKQLNTYSNLRSFILFFYGGNNPNLSSNISFLNMNPTLNVWSENKRFSTTADITNPLYINNKFDSNSIVDAKNEESFHRFDPFFIHQVNKFGKENLQLFKLTNKQTGVISRESNINLLEYNRILYQRIQKVILNIRENLNLNGQIKNRSKKLGKNVRPFIKRDYTKRDPNNGLPVNQNAVFWSKIAKNNVLKFGRSFVSSGYEESSPYNNASQLLSRNNFYWALNKSSTIPEANFNTSLTKKLWESYKIKEISKSNKTKKIIFNIFANYNSLFKGTNSLDGYDHVLEKFKKNDVNFSSRSSTFPVSLKNNYPANKEKKEVLSENNYRETEDSKFSRFFYKKNSVEKDPQIKLNYTSYALDDQSFKVPFTLSTKTYTVKSEQKLINIENKLKLLGLYSKKTQRNYKNSYFRFLKNELLKEKRFYSHHANQTVSDLDLFLNIKQKSLNTITNSHFNQNVSVTRQKMSNNYSYWWSSFKINDPYFEQYQSNIPFNIEKTRHIPQNNLNLQLVTLSSFLFHFCALVSFISLGGVRALIKFYYILISKVSKVIGNLEGVVQLLPKQNSFNNNTKLNIKQKSFMEFTPTKKDLLNTRESLNPKNSLINQRHKKRSSFLLTLNDDGLGSQKMPSIQNTLLIKNLKLSFLKYLTARSSVINNVKKTPLNLEFLLRKSYYEINSQASNISNNNQSYSKSLKSKTQFLTFNLEKSTKKREKIELFKILLRSLKNNQNTESAIYTSGQDLKKGELTNSLIFPNMEKNKLKMMYDSFLKLSLVMRFSHKVSFYTYLLLLKSVDILAVPASFIYKFFEKPGEYVVENLAYSFLVEWSADLISTIPDTVDTSQALYFAKINRSFSPLMLLNLGLNTTTLNLINNSLLTSKLSGFTEGRSLVSYQTGLLFGLSNSVLKRVLNSSFLVFIQQLCEPDLDYVNRQKKARSIWDIWGESLKMIAEENSINIYELTSDKDEQIKLLTKYEEALLNNQISIQKSNEYLSLPSFTTQGSERNPNLFKHSLYSLNKKLKKQSKLLQKTSEIIPSFLSFENDKNREKNKENLKTNLLSSNQTFIGTERNLAQSTRTKHNYYGWSVSQFLSYQGKDTDLFIDLHPPKNFSASAASLKYSFSVQQPIGSIVCQIFSGIFYKQISKNILVVGSAGLEKSLLIQAIAGETELKIITDNAHRYAMVYRGVAVGIKLLKDVFEALSVHTPCIFLMEDIHAIGERRPFLIDEASSNSSESTYNKNQSMQALFLKEKSSASREGLYKNNKHLLNHYKKPYKEPKGLATNHFSFTFLFSDLFTKTRNTEINLSSSLSTQVIKKENESKYKNIKSQLKDKLNNKQTNQYSSSLLIQQGLSEGLAPPASSPFSVLILKEATKLKHKKAVKEMPWFGLPGEQFSLVSKYNYSIRIKVALLADLVLSNLSVKLDMITDLLVIIDSVKANRGFVVFATTHVPYILDPALRRPGRFDETISLPLIPTLYSRWSNYRSNVDYLTTSLFSRYSIPFNYSLNKGTTLDLTKSHFLSTNRNETLLPIDKLINYISIKHMTSFLGEKTIKGVSPKNKIAKKIISKFHSNTKAKKTAWKHLLMSRLIDGSFQQNEINQNEKEFVPFYSSVLNVSSLTNSTKKYASSLAHLRQTKKEIIFKSSTNSISFEPKKKEKNQLSKKQALKLKSRNYSFACKSLISLMLYTFNNKNLGSNDKKRTNLTFVSSDNLVNNQKNNQQNLSLKWPNMLKNLNTSEDYSVYLSLFNTDKVMFKIILMSLIGGKLGEHFVVSSNLKRTGNLKNTTQILNQNGFNFDKTWKYASALLFNYIQKRQCSTLNKNLAFSATKLISFNNKYSLMEPPNPPISNILLPAKRYENYKRTFQNQYGTLNGQTNFGGTIPEKLQLHQQQRLLKRLYKYPIKEFFKSHLLKGNDSISNLANFNNSYLVLSPLEKTNLASVNKLSNVNWCYRNILYNRHKTYLTNQWWNGQQGEHNAETTFLSDIDWRYTFVQSIGDINIDFPDSEQFYNPRNRRWILTNGDWTYWFNIQVEFKDIYSHYAYECFTKTYKYLDQNRELIDFYTESLHQTPLASELKERNLLNLYKRFF